MEHLNHLNILLQKFLTKAQRHEGHKGRRGILKFLILSL